MAFDEWVAFIGSHGAGLLENLRDIPVSNGVNVSRLKSQNPNGLPSLKIVQDLNVPQSPLETTTITEHFQIVSNSISCRRGKAAAPPLSSTSKRRTLNVLAVMLQLVGSKVPSS
jgi:hypothetical protein